jgi:hypothetical protein
MTTRTLNWTLPLALLLSLALVGCKAKVKIDLELYPNGSTAASGGNVESVEGTLFKVKQVTPDGAKTVNEFFRKQLVEGKGWTEQGDGRFTDGNMKMDLTYLEFQDSDSPKDASKPGGMVVVSEVTDRTFIKIWRFVPKPAR